ncbi:SDR family oxidoreductase [Patescibacteria group bacterium]|nr:SDR family oxidoreductase [Patescibacteria group bacterium]
MFNLTGKVALITGAKQGMGLAHAKALASQGAKVVVTDINLAECQKVAEEIIGAGGQAIAFKMDVTDLQEINQVFAEVEKHYGRLDILINNAGVYLPKAATELTEGDWDKTIDINLKGQFFCAQAAAKLMTKNKWGRIINISSIASGQVGVGIAGGVHYTSSKGGVIGMSETMAIEWAPLGITVNVIAPGAIDTPMASSSDIPKEALQGLMARIPLNRMGLPEEVAAAAVFLASGEAGYVTGATLHVDGGWLAT